MFDLNNIAFSLDVCLFHAIHLTLPITKKKYAENLLHYTQLFLKGNVFIGEWGLFGADVFLRYSWFFVRGNFVIGGVECTISFKPWFGPNWAKFFLAQI